MPLAALGAHAVFEDFQLFRGVGRRAFQRFARQQRVHRPLQVFLQLRGEPDPPALHDAVLADHDDARNAADLERRLRFGRPQPDRIGQLVLRDELFDLIPVLLLVGAEPDHDDLRILRVGFRQFLHFRQRPHAWPAPRRPEIDDHHLALLLGQLERPAGQQRQLEVRRGLARQREAVQAGRFLDFPVGLRDFLGLFLFGRDDVFRGPLRRHEGEGLVRNRLVDPLLQHRVDDLHVAQRAGDLRFVFLRFLGRRAFRSRRALDPAQQPGFRIHPDLDPGGLEHGVHPGHEHFAGPSLELLVRQAPRAGFAEQFVQDFLPSVGVRLQQQFLVGLQHQHLAPEIFQIGGQPLVRGFPAVLVLHHLLVGRRVRPEHVEFGERPLGHQRVGPAEEEFRFHDLDAFHPPDGHFHAELRLFPHGLERVQLRRIGRPPRVERFVRRARPRPETSRQRQRRPFPHAAPPEWFDPTPGAARRARIYSVRNPRRAWKKGFPRRGKPCSPPVVLKISSFRGT